MANIIVIIISPTQFWNAFISELLVKAKFPVPYGKSNPFRCTSAVLPKATTSVFECKGKCDIKQPILVFIKDKPDNDRPPDETGYVTSAIGDSGSPYLISKDINGEKRAILVAIHFGSALDLDKDKIYNAYIKDDSYSYCRTIGTKITPKMVRWIKMKLKIPVKNTCFWEIKDCLQDSTFSFQLYF